MGSVMRLHLQYRLWIASMNADINVLRIFDDYISWLETKKNNAEAIKRIDDYKKQCFNLRNELDELRHEMHLIKMKLAAVSRKHGEPTENIKNIIHHKEYKDRYKIFRKKFSKTKKELKKY